MKLAYSLCAVHSMNGSFHRHFVGFFRCDHAIRLNRDVWEDVQSQFLDMLDRNFRPKVLELLSGFSHLCCKAHIPVVAHIQSERFGFCLLSMPSRDPILSDVIGKVNQYVISKLLALPFRTEREEEGELITRLVSSGVKPKMCDLQEMCIWVIASSNSREGVNQLPKSCKKEVERYRKAVKEHKKMTRSDRYVLSYCRALPPVSRKAMGGARS